MQRANRQKHLTMAQRGGIVGQHLGGLSNGHIARTLNVSVNSQCFNARLFNRKSSLILEGYRFIMGKPLSKRAAS